MLFRDITYIDKNMEEHRHCFVGTIDDKIVYVSDAAPNDDEIQKFGEVYEGKNKLLLPGFVNAHSHAAATILRSYADNQPLDEWLNKWIFPFEGHMTGDDYYWATLLGFAEMQRYGITSCSDMYFFAKNRIRAIEISKMKCNLSECIISFDDIHFKDHPLYNDTVDIINNFNNAFDGRLKIDMNIHAEYTTKELICREIGEFAKEHNLINTIHVSETKSEHEECKSRHNGLSPIEYFNKIGVLDGKVHIAHGVWLEPNDMQIMKDKGVSVATNPSSNLKLGSGIADLPTILNNDINLCIGTDGMASNNSHDFIRTMYLVAILNRGLNHDSTLMDVKDVFYAATKAGSLSQGRSDCGSIEVGNKADLCVMDLTEPIWCPGQNLLNNLIYAGQGSDVCLTMIDGNIVYKDGDWPYIDIEKVKAEVIDRRNRIISEL